MRLEYEKPEIIVEDFKIDIDIARSCSGINQQMQDLLEYWNGMSEDEKNEDYGGTGEDAFQDFLKIMGYDNSTSGYCYFTSSTPLFKS